MAVRTGVIAALVHDWPVTEQGQRRLQHVVGGRPAGTIPATWVLTRPSLNERLGKSAQFESAIGFSICGLVAVARFGLLNPSAEDYMVKGSIAAATWNRDQALKSVQGVRLEGNLPITRVSASVRGRTVRGQVADCHGHAVAAVPVVLEQRVGSRWRRARSGKAGANGSFSLAAPAPGTYRVRVAARSSASVRVP